MTPNMVTIVGVKTPLKVDSFGDADMDLGGYEVVSCQQHLMQQYYVFHVSGVGMEDKEVWQTSLTKIELIQQLRTMTEPIEEFRLVSRLSGAGIVVRTLEIPQTSKPLMGKVSDKEIVIAQTLDPVNISPYQPIVTVNFLDSSIELTFRPHQDVYLLSPVEWLGGFVCIVSGAVGMLQNPLALLAILLGIAIVAFPRYRAQWNFDRELKRAKSGLQELPIDWRVTGE